MTSLIDYELIDIHYPVPGKDNSTQGMRNNFTYIQDALQVAYNEITALQSLLTDTVQNAPIIRVTNSVTTELLLDNASEELTMIEVGKGYVLYTIESTDDAWVRIYTDVDSRTADASRLITTPAPANSGIVLDIQTVANTTIKLAPAVYGYNDEIDPSPELYMTITNKSGATATITVFITLLPLED